MNAGTCPDTRIARVGEPRDHRHQLPLDRAVDLDLDVAAARVIVDGRARLGFVVHLVLDRPAEGPAAVHEARENDARPDRRPVVEPLLDPGQDVGIVAEIADRRDAVDDVEQAVPGRKMHVHVPEARKQGLSRGVDDLRPGWP
jgi:hypothetical protein